MIVEIKDMQGNVVAVILITPKTFSTGSKGFFGNGKIEIDGKKYQTQVQLVEIGSKPS